MTDLPDATAVAEFLLKNPDFFEHHPALLAGLKLTTTLGGRTVSLQERQVDVLREKIKQLELKLSRLTQNAGNNDIIMSNFHQWILRLLNAQGHSDGPELVLSTLKESFNVPAAALRLWDVKPSYEGAWFAVDSAEAAGVSEAVAFANSEKTPLCGPAAGKPGVSWLDSAATMQSTALVPLRKPGSEQSFGLLVLGSPDPERFSSELGTDFLTRIGETVSARLQGLIG